MRSWRRIVTLLVAAGCLAAIVVLPLGDQRQLSVEAWLAVVAGLLAIFSIMGLMDVVPMRTDTSTAFMRRSRQEYAPQRRLPRNLLSTEGTLVSARDNSRAFALRLQPRLIEVAEHYLQTDHGTDGDLQTAQVDQILGETAWLLNKTRTKRTPDPSEVGLFVDRLVEKRSTSKQAVQEILPDNGQRKPT